MCSSYTEGVRKEEHTKRITEKKILLYVSKLYCPKTEDAGRAKNCERGFFFSFFKKKREKVCRRGAKQRGQSEEDIKMKAYQKKLLSGEAREQKGQKSRNNKKVQKKRAWFKK